MKELNPNQKTFYYKILQIWLSVYINATPTSHRTFTQLLWRYFVEHSCDSLVFFLLLFCWSRLCLLKQILLKTKKGICYICTLDIYKELKIKRKTRAYIFNSKTLDRITIWVSPVFHITANLYCLSCKSGCPTSWKCACCAPSTSIYCFQLNHWSVFVKKKIIILHSQFNITEE
jgi:hypothetical protein